MSLNDGYLYAFDANAQQIWRTNYTNGKAVMYSSEPIVADLNQDGSLEILISTYGDPHVSDSGHLIVLAADGSLLHDIPLPDPGYDGNGNGAPAAPAVGDIDGDGTLKVFVQTFDHGIEERVQCAWVSNQLRVVGHRARGAASHGPAQHRALSVCCDSETQIRRQMPWLCRVLINQQRVPKRISICRSLSSTTESVWDTYPGAEARSSCAFSDAGVLTCRVSPVSNRPSNHTLAFGGNTRMLSATFLGCCGSWVVALGAGTRAAYALAV